MSEQTRLIGQVVDVLIREGRGKDAMAVCGEIRDRPVPAPGAQLAAGGYLFLFVSRFHASVDMLPPWTRIKVAIVIDSYGLEAMEVLVIRDLRADLCRKNCIIPSPTPHRNFPEKYSHIPCIYSVKSNGS
jgi:hypothetical protein